MKIKEKTRFKKVNSRPRWEGIIFTNIDFSDTRISIFAAEPNGQLKDYIEYIWYMKWDLSTDSALTCIVVPNPCTKLVVLQQNEITYNPIVIGPKQKGELFNLQGTGATIGFDFKPGALYSILGKSMNNWPETGFKGEELFKDLPLSSDKIWNEINLTEWLEKVESYLLNHKLNHAPKNSFKQITMTIDNFLENPDKTLEDLAQQAGVSLRTLQRIFNEEVGLSPRDLLRVARFNKAIQQIGHDDFKTFANTAVDSGFFDQPHMVNEFKKLIATSPSKFRRYL
jgi:AraC-like DNA-binding protein